MADDLDATVTKALAVQIPVEHRTVRTNIVLAISHQCLGECAEVLTVLPPQTYAAAKADCSKDDFDSLTLRVYELYSLGRLREALASLPPPHVSAPLGASTGAARVEDLRGVVLSGLAQWDDAELALKAARGLAEKCGQDEVFADAGLHLASLYYEVDRDSEALPVLKQSVAHFERTGNVEMLAFAGGLLALLYDSLGQHGRATEWARRSVDRAEQCENVENIGAALSASAWVALVEGRHGLAAAQYQQVLTMLPSDSCIDLWMDCHAGLGIIALVTGDLRGSLRSFVTTLRRAAYCETKNRVVTAKCLRGLVQLADRLQVADLRADIFALGRVLDVAFCEAPLPVGYALEDMRALLAHFRQGSPIGLPSVHATAGLLVPTRRSADRLLTDIAARLSGGMP
jgi:tetratricopeptide (TPR) repeat protein